VPPSVTLPEQRANGEGMPTDDTDEDDDVFTDYHYDSKEEFDGHLGGVVFLLQLHLSPFITTVT